MKAAAFLALGLVTAGAQSVTPCLTQAEIDNLTPAQLAQLGDPLTNSNQLALYQLLYQIYGPGAVSLDGALSCEGRCGPSAVSTGTTTSSGCVSEFTRDNVVYTYLNGGYVSSSVSLGTGVSPVSNAGCTCDANCSPNCCADQRLVCGLDGSFVYDFQVVATRKNPIPVPVPVIRERLQPFPVASPVDVYITETVPKPVPVASLVDFPVPQFVPRDRIITQERVTIQQVPVGSPVPRPVPQFFAKPVPFTVVEQQPVPSFFTQFQNVPVASPYAVASPVPYPVAKYIPNAVPVTSFVPIPYDQYEPVPSPTNVPFFEAVARPVPVARPVRQEVTRYRDVPVPVPVPIYVNNPIPQDYVVTQVRQVNVPTESLYTVPINSPYNSPVPRTIIIEEDVPQETLIPVPYPAIEQVEIAIPTYIPVAVPRTTNIPMTYTVQESVDIPVENPVQIIEYVKRPIGIEIKRAVARVEVPVFLGTEQGSQITSDLVPGQSVTGTQSIDLGPNWDSVQFIGGTLAPRQVETPPQGFASQQFSIGSSCVGFTGTPPANIQCIGGLWQSWGVGLPCATFLNGQIFANLQCTAGFWRAYNAITLGGVCTTAGEIVQGGNNLSLQCTASNGGLFWARYVVTSTIPTCPANSAPYTDVDGNVFFCEEGQFTLANGSQSAFGWYWRYGYNTNQIAAGAACPREDALYFDFLCQTTSNGLVWVDTSTGGGQFIVTGR